MKTVLLNNGMRLPLLGLGTFGMKEASILSAIAAAKEAGIRLFDTSPNYKVDVSLGQAFKQVGLRREEITIVEKVDTSDQLLPIGISLENCLKRLNMDYIDLYLIHWPFPGRYIDTWKQMERFCREGVVKAIGVCNFMPHHLEPLLKGADIVPAVNQIELHPLFTQKDTVEYCRKNDVAVMAYTPLGRMNPALIDNPVIQTLAEKYGKTAPQIILRWNIQSEFIVIPKSESPVRIRENSEIFDFCLLDEEIAAIDALNCNSRFRFDPDDLSRYPLSLSFKRRLSLQIRAWKWKLKHLYKKGPIRNV